MKHTIFKGKTLTEDDILRAMEKFDREYRSTFPPKRWVTYAVKHDGKLYPPKETIRIATGMRDIGPGGQPVNSRFEELGFSIVTIGEQNEQENNDTGQEEATETPLSLERDLENFLVANLSQLEPNLQLYREKGFTGRQCDTRIVGVIDVLAVDGAGDFVVIELKAGEANDRVCGQIQRYMGWVKENLAESHKVRGIIVASDFSDGLLYAAKSMSNVALKKYAVSFRFTSTEG